MNNLSWWFTWKAVCEKIRQTIYQPCLCLCFGFSQITLILPFLLMILHFSQIGLTDDLTFTVILLSVIVRPPKDTQRAVCCILQSSNAGLQVHLSNSPTSLSLGSQLQKGRSILMPQQSSLEHYNTYFYRLQADLCLFFLVFTGFSGTRRLPGKGRLQEVQMDVAGRDGGWRGR
mgnify:FL=1